MNLRNQVPLPRFPDRPAHVSPSQKTRPFVKPVPSATVEVPRVKVPGPASDPGLEPAGAELRAGPAVCGKPDPTASEISILGNRRLWLAPLLGETVLCIGAAWLSRSLDNVIWSSERGFPAVSLLLLALAYAGLAAYSHVHELFMPRAVVLIGVGTLVLVTAGAGLGFMVEGYVLGGIYRLRYLPLATVPLALFLTRCFFVFRAARSAPSLSRFIVRARARNDSMRKLRARLRYWLS